MLSSVGIQVVLRSWCSTYAIALLFAAAAACVACVTATAQDTEEVAAKPLPTCPADVRGCWATDTEPRHYARFEDGTCMFAAAGSGAQVLRAAYAPGMVYLRMQGQEQTVAVVVKDGLLTLSGGGGSQAYRRLNALPSELNVDPLALGEPKPIPAERVKTIQTDLAQRLLKDQTVRVGRMDSEKMRAVDADNTAYLKTLVTELGWIDVERFGQVTALAAFLIVQHSGDIQLMKAALPEVEKDVKANHLDGGQYALLYDRLQLMTGGKQRYGTQVIQTPTGGIAELEDKEKVDQWRRELGMGPLADYLKSFGSGVNGAVETK